MKQRDNRVKENCSKEIEEIGEVLKKNVISTLRYMVSNFIRFTGLYRVFKCTFQTNYSDSNNYGLNHISVKTVTWMLNK